MDHHKNRCNLLRWNALGMVRSGVRLWSTAIPVPKPFSGNIRYSLWTLADNRSTSWQSGYSQCLLPSEPPPYRGALPIFYHVIYL